MSGSGNKAAIIAVLSLSVAICFPLTGCRKEKKELARRPRPVKILKLTKEVPSDASRFTATVAPWKTEEIGFEVGGRVEMVVEPNTEVAARVRKSSTDSELNEEAILDGILEAVKADIRQTIGAADNKEGNSKPVEKTEQEDDALKSIEEDTRELLNKDMKDEFERPRTVIAQLETERYRLQVAKAQAEVTRAIESLKAAVIEHEFSIPRQIDAAVAKKDLADIELQRSKNLADQNAGAKADVDRDLANQKDAAAQILILEASMKAKAAEVVSLEASFKQAVKDLRDAKRDLEDCTLYASFNGEVSDVSIVPGSVVQPGEPAVLLQMMDPIKVELEVSARLSRQLKRTDLVPVTVTMPDGSNYKKELKSGELGEPLGYLYLIDQVADPETKTFTITILMENDKLSRVEPNEEQKVTASTKDMWPLNFRFLPGTEEDELYVEKRAMLQDAEGYYVWAITNLTEETRKNRDNFLKVRKLRIKLLKKTIPWLGDWEFRQVSVDDPEFDPNNKMLICGELEVSSGRPADWTGDTVYRDTNQWLLRPGDIVTVDLSGPEADPGFYVPMESIVRENGKPFIFVMEKEAGKSVAKRIPIETETSDSDATSAFQRIRSINKEITLEGRNLITEGAHYLIDGEPVAVAHSDGEDAATANEATK